MPLRVRRCSTPAILLVTLLGTAPGLVAQDYSGEYALATEGQTVLAVTLVQAKNGNLTGSVMSGDKTLPVSGSVRNGIANFISAGPSGGFLQWSTQLRADSLAATLVPTGADGRPDQAQTQYHMLVRLRTPGDGAKRVRGSQKWLAALVSAADSVLSWCGRPDYASGGFCRTLLPTVQRIGPALMVTRLALGGGPGAPPPVGAPAPGSSFPPPAFPAATTVESAPAHAVEAQAVSVEPTADKEVTSKHAATPGRNALAALGAGQRPATPSSYDFVLVNDGSVVLAIALTVAPDGSASGSVSAGENTVTLAGSVAGAEVRFTTTAPDGTATEWHGSITDSGLTITVPGPDGEETYALTVRAR